MTLIHKVTYTGAVAVSTKKNKTKSAVKKIVRTPMFRMRVEEDKTKYNRKKKHKNLEE